MSIRFHNNKVPTKNQIIAEKTKKTMMKKKDEDGRPRDPKTFIGHTHTHFQELSK